MNTIAEEHFVFIAANGARTSGRIAVGAPYLAPGGEYRCDLVLDGVEPRPHAIAGDSSLQALLLAMRFAGKRIHDFKTRGGRVVYPPGNDDTEESDAALDAYFGPMLCE